MFSSMPQQMKTKKMNYNPLFKIKQKIYKGFILWDLRLFQMKKRSEIEK